MDNQAKTSTQTCAEEPARNLMQDPALRLRCLELATCLPNLKGPDEAITAANEFAQYVAGRPIEPPTKASNLPAYQQRVIDEKNELDQKLTSLRGFFESVKFTTIDPEEQRRLQDQAKFMQQYSDILWLRIDNFSKGGA